MNKSANLLELESLRTELIEKTFNSSSYLNKLFLFVNCFEKILSLDNPNYKEAFLKEFIEDYLTSIKKFDGWSAKPAFIIRLIATLNILCKSNSFLQERTFIQDEAARLKKQLAILEYILEGKSSNTIIECKAFFPLIDKENADEFYGIIDSITVRINKCNDANKFIIVPSEKDLEKKIDEQVKTSWELALSLSKKYLKKTFRFHEVIISFDKRAGFYEGNSLGISLTLSFLEQLLKFYNPSYVINIKERTAFTGGVKQNGQILDTSEDIIKRKVAAIFFSEINLFVIPKLDESYAYFALTQLKQKYPERNLKIISVEDFNDVLNRRDIVDIKKQKIVVRSGKFVKKNWISAVATVLLAILFAYLFVMDFDDNPASYSMDGRKIFIKNNNGKVLWEKGLLLSEYSMKNLRILPSYVWIIDVNNDGEKEVLLQSEYNEVTNTVDNEFLKCFDKKGHLLWKFSFTDSINSERESLGRKYGISIVDTVTFNNEKSLCLISNNLHSFSSAFYRIKLQTGVRLPGTIYCSGHIVDALLKNLNNETKKDIIVNGFDNGYEDAVLFVTTFDTLIKVRPSTKEYQIKNYPLADVVRYIRIPKLDFDNYYQKRSPGIPSGSLVYDPQTKQFSFESIIVLKGGMIGTVGYIVNDKLRLDEVTISSDFRVQRDTLVAHNKLYPPYTDTQDYKQIIMDKILYWKNGKWVNRNEINE